MVAVLCLALFARAEPISDIPRGEKPEQLSGISRISDDRYLCVEDVGGMLYEATVAFTNGGKAVSFSATRSLKLEGRRDLEGCAYDPLTGWAWAVDEDDASVRAFDLGTGKQVALAPVPEVFRKAIYNSSLESLTISSDGLKMYTANEDTLVCDGKPANREQGGLVRIQEFTRPDGKSPWTASRQFRYRTDPVGGDPYKGIAISGVADLCSVGNGELIVLEREMSQKNPFFPTFRGRLYSVSTEGGGEELVKRRLWDANTVFANYEGVCLGPTLTDGRMTLLLISDGGHRAEKRMKVLALSPHKQEPTGRSL